MADWTCPKCETNNNDEKCVVCGSARGSVERETVGATDNALHNSQSRKQETADEREYSFVVKPYRSSLPKRLALFTACTVCISLLWYVAYTYDIISLVALDGRFHDQRTADTPITMMMPVSEDAQENRLISTKPTVEPTQEPTSKPAPKPTPASTPKSTPTWNAEEEHYNNAVQMLDMGMYREAAIEFGWALGYKDALKRKYEIERKQFGNGTFSAEFLYSVGLLKEGSIKLIGDTSGMLSHFGSKVSPLKISALKGSAVISAGMHHVLGLQEDGTVRAYGANENGQCDTDKWSNIIAISAGNWFSVGIKSDGTVEFTGEVYGYNAINKYGESRTYNKAEWKNIVAVDGQMHVLGLRSDGTVVAMGDNTNNECYVDYWRDIIAVAGGGCHSVGLKSDGTVVAVGSNGYGQCNVKEWRDIVAIGAGGFFTVGLKADGTVVAVGCNDDGECNVSKWKNIIAISVGNYNTLGLMENRTMVGTGYNKNGQRNVGKWKIRD